MNTRRIRIWQTIISISLFTGVFFLCWLVTGFNILNIQLSFFGINPISDYLWNSCLMLLSASIFYNVFHFIKEHKRLNFKPLLVGGFFFVSLFLFLTGAVNMNYSMHNAFAYLYFFLYPLSIFVLAHLNRKVLLYREWKRHTTFSICMVVFPLLTIELFPGMAITEIIHSTIVIGWNLWILLED